MSVWWVALHSAKHGHSKKIGRFYNVGMKKNCEYYDYSWTEKITNMEVSLLSRMEERVGQL